MEKMGRRDFLKLMSITGLGGLSLVAPGCCAADSLERIVRHAVTGSPTGSWSGSSIPSPQAGLVLPINRSPGVWAECWLFEGSFSERNLITSHPTIRGMLIFVKSPIEHFKINPPMSQPYKNGVMSSVITRPVLLPTYPAQYTLLVFHQNARGWVVRMQTIRFRITGYPFNQHFISGGKKVYADKVIKLAKCKPYEKRSFKFHRTYYPGHALMQAFGF